jgi:DNA-binding winged helix-turn-helix (wHTH) protein
MWSNVKSVSYRVLRLRLSVRLLSFKVFPRKNKQAGGHKQFEQAFPCKSQCISFECFFHLVEIIGQLDSKVLNYPFQYVEVNLHTGELRQRGQKVKLQEQPLQVLAALLEKRGEIVTREELRTKLWSADTFVDFDHSLNAAIKRLRDALGESAETPIFVETLARRGYRFIGNIETPATTSSARPRTWVSTRRTTAVLGGLTAGALALFFLYYSHSLRSKASPLAVTGLSPPRGWKVALRSRLMEK